MARYAYQRLSARSATLLRREGSRRYGHSGATLVFQPGPLGRPDGGVDFNAIRFAIESRLHRVPGFRRKLRWIPVESHPVWVDDPEFNIEYHVRHTSLPRPGTMAQLRRVAARVQAQRLDRSRPLWEYWVVEGFDDGRFALIAKTHAALVEGSGADLMQVLLSHDPDAALDDPPPYRARPVPSAAELFYDEVLRDLRLARRRLRSLRLGASRPDLWARGLRSSARTTANLLGYELRGAPETPLNGAVGPHRRVDHLALPVSVARSVRRAFGVSFLDVILATLAGAVARYLELHYVNPATLDFRVAVPVSLGEGRAEAVGEWVLDLPIWERDPVKRLQRIGEVTRARAEEGRVVGAGDVYRKSDWRSSRVPAQGAHAIVSQTPVNLRLAWFPGPREPLFLRGARLVECYGNVPLAINGGLGVAVFGYTDKLCWGINGDFDLVPDLSRFTESLRRSYRELERAASGRTLSVVRASGQTA